MPSSTTTQYDYASHGGDVAARRVSAAARPAVAARAASTACASSPAPSSLVRRSRLLRQRRRAVHAADAARFAGRLEPQPGRGSATDTTTSIPRQSPPWEDVRDALVFRRGASPTEASQYLLGLALRHAGARARCLRRVSFRPRRPLLEAAIDLMHRIHDELPLRSSATTITTPVTRVLEERHGVCQDFAHLQISCLRSLGLAARYVSGYLLTDPPPGPAAPDRRGRVARVAVGALPAARMGGSRSHERARPRGCATSRSRWGRDYGDVSPLRGVMLGGAEHTLTVGVSVVPIAAI